MNKKKIQTLLIPLILCACSLEKEKPQENKSDIQFNQNLKAIESSSHPNQYFAYSINCENDSLRVFYNDSSEGDNHVYYKQHKEFDSEYGYFFERAFYEGGDWIFVSKMTCFEIDLFGEVILNPSKKKFASIGQDNAAGYSENGVQIFSFSHEYGNVKKEIEDTLSIAGKSQYGPSQWHWKNDSTFSVLLMDLDNNSMRREYNYGDGKWTFADSPIYAEIKNTEQIKTE
jgi:hypothetical protein